MARTKKLNKKEKQEAARRRVEAKLQSSKGKKNVFGNSKSVGRY